MPDNVSPFFRTSYDSDWGSNNLLSGGVKAKCRRKSSPELPLPNPSDTSSLIFVSIASHRYVYVCSSWHLVIGRVLYWFSLVCSEKRSLVVFQVWWKLALYAILLP